MSGSRLGPIPAHSALERLRAQKVLDRLKQERRAAENVPRPKPEDRDFLALRCHEKAARAPMNHQEQAARGVAFICDDGVRGERPLGRWNEDCGDV